MAYQAGIAEGTLHLAKILDRFLIGCGIPEETADGMHFRAAAGNTGNGRIRQIFGTTATVTETWTLTFTSSTAFNVSGSVSGAAAAGTVGVAYANTWIEFLVEQGGILFLAGDVLTIGMTRSPLITASPSQVWIRRNPSDVGTPGARNQKQIYEGPGLAGTDAILVGIDTPDDALTPAQEYLRVIGLATFSGANPFYAQVGYSGVNSPSSPSWIHRMPYWLVGNGRRWSVVFRVGWFWYHTLAGGFLDPIALPGEWPYPLFVGGSNYGGFEYDENSGATSPWCNPASEAVGGTASTLRIRDWENTWHQVINWGSTLLTHSDTADEFHVWPFWEEQNNTGGEYSRGFWGAVMEGPKGEFPLMPLTLLRGEGTNQGILASIPMAYWTTAGSRAHGNSDPTNEALRGAHRLLLPEDEILAGGSRFKVFPMEFGRFTRKNAWALRLE